MAKRLICGGFTGLFSRGGEAAPNFRDGAVRLALAFDDDDPSNVLEDRIRPTGESGSGPYFHSIQTLEGGARRIYTDYNGDFAVTWGDYSKIVKSTGTPSGYETWNLCRYKAMGDRFVVVTIQCRGSAYSARDCIWEVKSYILCSLDATKQRAKWWCYSTSKSYTFASGDDMSVRWAIMSSEAEARYDMEVRYVKAVMSIPYTNSGYSRFADEVDAKIQNTGYRYGEYDAFEWWRLTDVLPNRYGALSRAAFIDACENLPEAHCNSIANVLEVASSVADIIKGKRISFKSWKEVWLAYRYSYSTTKSDIEEYAELTRRLISLAGIPVVTSRGSASDGQVDCQCTISVDASQALPSNLREWLRIYGFRFSAVNAWDMIPYSFIADWFTHIGDWLQTLEDIGDSMEVPILESWTSFRTNYDERSTLIRIPGHDGFRIPYVSYKSPSSKTIFKRILDGIALFT